LLCSYLSLSGQTKKELEKISTSKSIYVRNGVVMKPRFDNKGQICRLSLSNENDPNKTALNGKNLITGENVEEILDSLFPLNLRGDKRNWGIGLMLGQIVITDYEYDNIKISSTNLIFRKNRKMSSSEILDKTSSGIYSAESFAINWTNRKCRNED